MSTSFQLTTADGLLLAGASHPPQGNGKGVFVVIHGMGEHFGRYKHLVTFLKNNGYATVGVDHRGHGKSQGKRGHAPSLDHLLDDIDLVVKKATELFAGLPVVLYGHSLGGNLAANYVLRRKPRLQGLILTSPYFRLAFEPPRWKFFLAKALAKIIPSLTLPTALEQAALSRDPAVVAAYQNGPLVHDKMSTSFFTAVHPAGLSLPGRAKELAVKTLVMHGTADRLTSPDATRKFACNNPEMITLKLWDGFYHELHNEQEQQVVFSYIVDWASKLQVQD